MVLCNAGAAGSLHSEESLSRNADVDGGCVPDCDFLTSCKNLELRCEEDSVVPRDMIREEHRKHGEKRTKGPLYRPVFAGKPVD